MALPTPQTEPLKLQILLSVVGMDAGTLGLTLPSVRQKVAETGTSAFVLG